MIVSRRRGAGVVIEGLCFTAEFGLPGELLPAILSLLEGLHGATHTCGDLRARDASSPLCGACPFHSAAAWRHRHSANRAGPSGEHWDPHSRVRQRPTLI